MELKHMTAFIAVYEEGSINRGAHRLGSPQPSTSVLIRDLEIELGALLFERNSRGIAPTEQAKTLYPHFQQIIAKVEMAKMSVSGRLTEQFGPLRVGLGPAITRGLLSDILPLYVDKYPRVQVRITEGFTGKLLEWTLAGELDFAVITLPPTDRRVIGRRLTVDPMVLVSGRAAGRVHMEVCSLAQETPLKLVLPWSPLSIRDVIDPKIDSGEIPVDKIIEVDSLSGILGLVENSDWVTFMPLTTVCRELRHGQLVIQPVVDPAMTVEIYLIYPARGTLSGAALAFIDLLESGFQNISQQWSALMCGDIKAGSFDRAVSS